MRPATRGRAGPTARGGGARRGTVIYIVLVVVSVGAFAAAGVVSLADAGVTSARLSVRRDQARALAWSGVQAAAAELAAQRDDLIRGREPSLTDSAVVYETESGELGVFRLFEFGAGRYASSESARLDANTASEEMLARLPGLGEAGAAAIVAARDARPFSTVEEVALAEGLDASLFEAPGPGAMSDTATLPLADLLGVFAADPDVECGIADGGDAFVGDRRLNLGQPWSEALGRRIARRFDQGAVDLARQIMSQRRFKTQSDVARLLVELGADDHDVGRTLDVLSVTGDEFRLGLVDLNRAPAEVLACLPGIDADAAAAIVDRRAGLDEATTLSVSWPLAEGILGPDDFLLAIDHLTTRSMQWRVRVEAGVIAASGGANDPADLRTADLRDRVELEAVIDVASEKVRIAYLRDVSMLEATRAVLDQLAAEQADGGDAEPVAADAEPDEPSGQPGPGDSGPDETGAGDEAGGRTVFRPARLARDSERSNPTPTGADSPGEDDGPGAGNGDDAGTVGAAGEPGGEVDDQPVDRRIGRWTTRHRGPS